MTITTSKKTTSLFSTILLLSVTLLLHSCNNEEDKMKSVDLRYKVEDAYTIESTNPTPIEFLVKSTDPWEVYGRQDWYTISPDHGKPDTTLTVTIICMENKELDDRIDTVTIKSDYWIGKEFAITQKGTAYLHLENDQDFMLDKESTQRTFNIFSNQSWSAQVTEGEEWLSIVKGENGSLNGEVTVVSSDNKGEKRSGIITIYDRHQIECASVVCTQEGVILTPSGDLFKVYYQEQELIIPIESNTEWFVQKEEEDDIWYSFNQTEFNESDNLVIKFDEHTGNNVRKSTIILSTKGGKDIQPITKSIVLKQGYLSNPVRREFASNDLGSSWTIERGSVSFDGDAHFTPGRVIQDNMPHGYYTFRLKELSADAYSVIYFVYGNNEVRFHVDAASGMTDISISPWASLNDVPIDINKPHSLSLDMTDVDGKLKVEWILDNQPICSTVSSLSFDQTALVYLGCLEGSCVYDWYEYTPPVDWGE